MERRTLGKIAPDEGDPTEHILGIAAELEQGRAFPELIFVGPAWGPGGRSHPLSKGTPRATAYAYSGKPDGIEALVGVSSNLFWLALGLGRNA
jgi:hypothetical protein